MDINQLVTIKFLNALNQANSNSTNKSNNLNNGFDLFDFVLNNAIGNNQENNCNCTCHCHDKEEKNNFEPLKTLQSNINSNKVKNYNKPINTTNSNQLNKVKHNLKNLHLNKIKSNIENVPQSMFKALGQTNINPYNNNMDNAVKLIESKIGNKYVWGSVGPDSFDCSGLVQYVYKNALGKNLPRTSYEQSKVGVLVNKKDLQVGDLIFFDTMGKGRVSHVGMYVGNNEFVHASNEKSGIKKSKLTGYYENHYICARRP